MLIVDGIKYKPWTPQNEEREFHPLIKNNAKEIFGKDTIYFDVKTLIKTASGIGTIPDAYVLRLSQPYEWYVIENELATHSIYGHVINQLTKFINGIDNKDTRNQILQMLYEIINKENTLRETISAKTGHVDIHYFLSKLFLEKDPRIVVIIDRVTLDLEEACQALRYTPDIIEFKSFVREDGSKSYAHLFEPLSGIEEISRTDSKIELKESGRQNWELMVRDLDEPIRKATLSLIEKLKGLNNVVFRGKTSCSVFIKQVRGKYGFVGLKPFKSELRIIIRDDPTISDPKSVLNKKSAHWFTVGIEKQERDFRIINESQVDYAFELIKQSYEIIKKREFSQKSGE
jgi:hypothetical protein